MIELEEKIINDVFGNEYDENKLTDFLIKTKKAYDLFGYEFKLKEKYITDEIYQSALVWTNDKCIGKVIWDIDIVSIGSVYPKLISKMSLDGINGIDINLDYFGEVYGRLLDIYLDNRNIHLRKYINMAYGCIQNPRSAIYSSNMYMVSAELNKIMNDIINEFGDYIIYIDTDMIYFMGFDKIRDRFALYFKDLKDMYNFSYSTVKSRYGLFNGLKKYLVEDNGSIRVKGLKEINK